MHKAGAHTMRKKSKLSEKKRETQAKSGAERTSEPKKRVGSRIVDITDQFPGESFIITGVEKPKQ